MGRLLAENFAKNMSRVATLGVGAGALLAVVALSPIAALALPMGPLNKANMTQRPSFPIKSHALVSATKTNPSKPLLLVIMVSRSDLL